MNTDLIKYLRDFLSLNDIDALVINSTNEYLVEYNKLEYNSRYYVTDFTGSTGDVLLTSEKIYLFVDTRYHEQADSQANKEYVEVIKMPLNQSYLNALTEKIPPYYKLGMISKKTSKYFYDALLKNIQTKNASIKLFDNDPVIEYLKENIPALDYNVFQIEREISGMSADEKYNLIKEYSGENKYNILVTSLEDIAYLTNMRSYDFDYSAIFPAKALITENGIKIFSDCNIPYIGKNFTVLPQSEYENTIKSLINQDIFIDETGLSIYDYNLINSNNQIKQSHMKLFKTVKNDNEIEHMKKCFERSDKALKIIVDMINSEKIYTEYDYYEALIKSLKEKGALSLSFKPIVAAGKNSSVIHYGEPSKTKKVENGDFLLVDYGAYYEGGYSTDTTRTFIKGEASDEQKYAYTAVLKAFLNAYYKEYNKKSSYFDIDKTTRDIISKNLSPEYPFAHSTGHGVGICVHENPPRVSSSEASKTKIIENTVFSVEPGVYKENWGGIRLENTVFAKYDEDNKVRLHSLSKFPFEIKLVELSTMNDYEKYYYMKWQADSCMQ